MCAGQGRAMDDGMARDDGRHGGLTHGLTRLVGRGSFRLHDHVATNTHIANGGEAQRVQSISDGLALRIEDAAPRKRQAVWTPWDNVRKWTYGRRQERGLTSKSADRRSPCARESGYG